MISSDALDTILTLQLTVAWAGEGLSAPKRLDWWETDLIDEDGGGDFFARLLPKTARWAGLAAARNAAQHIDTRARRAMARPDRVRTLFFWGFDLDEAISDRLRAHVQSGTSPEAALPFPVDLTAPFDRAGLEAALGSPDGEAGFTIVPHGRELTGPLPAALEDRAGRLAAALFPPAPDYPVPFFRE